MTIKAEAMTSHFHSKRHNVELEILTYLYDNSDAQDTLEGIVQWWLLERHIRQQYALVRQALSELVNQDLIIATRESKTETRYRVNQQKIQEIQVILNRS